MAFDLDSALAQSVAAGASDLHVKVPSRPRMRVNGVLVNLPKGEPLNPQDTARVKEQVLTSEVKQRQFEEIGSTDISYFTDEARYRVSAFLQRGTASFVFRVVPHAPEVEDLGLPDVIPSWADAIRGLVVVTGPTGSGKSTTVAAIIDIVNRRRSCHILTIEDPIEYLHTDHKAVVCQREIGLDAPTYHVALRAALRQDPDVIVIGEVRDEETAMTALRASETGHLVLCTMHTVNATETVQRFIDLFGSSQAGLARQVLASTLVGISSQRLLPGANGGRVLNAEVLVNSARVRDMIAGHVEQKDIEQAIREGDYYGMQTFDQDLMHQVRDGLVTVEDAIAYATDPHDFKLALDTSEPIPARTR
ncbi:MAG TPA: PilT/PilU family type 4a pilus ATPase [Thermoleophilaceae bacterium]